MVSNLTGLIQQLSSTEHDLVPLSLSFQTETFISCSTPLLHEFLTTKVVVKLCFFFIMLSQYCQQINISDETFKFNPAELCQISNKLLLKRNQLSYFSNFIFITRSAVPLMHCMHKCLLIYV